MNRRSFLGASAAVAVAGVPAVALPSPEAVRKLRGRRVSVIEGDPGNRLYAMACGDGKRITVYLNGVEQKRAVTADEAEGYVERVVSTPEGNIAYSRSTGQIFHETVYGDVQIVIA